MNRCLTLLLLILVLAEPRLSSSQEKVRKERLNAPTYYLVAEVAKCQPKEIVVHGATNLPKGSIVGLQVSAFLQDGWNDYSDESFASVGDTGFFDAIIRPRSKAGFQRNLILVSSFTTYRPRQPEGVMNVVGKKGENLGDIENPQLAQLSGQHKILQSIARVPNCGE